MSSEDKAPTVLTIKCVVAAHGHDGPDLYFVKVRCLETQYDSGDHYAAAEADATDEGYDGPMVAFDENDNPKALFDLFVWAAAAVLDITDNTLES